MTNRFIGAIISLAVLAVGFYVACIGLVIFSIGQTNIQLFLSFLCIMGGLSIMAYGIYVINKSN
jgi:hypothetical protein